MICLLVERCGHLGSLGNISAVHQPEPGAHLGHKYVDSSQPPRGDERTYRGGEVDAVADEVQRGAASHVLPLGSGGPTWQQTDRVSNNPGLVKTQSVLAVRHLSNIMVRGEGAQDGSEITQVSTIIKVVEGN